eukprot:CAMPEP_0202949042 /NCGR_PEP_ID=MMETSP1395-20130829/14887_1 /ASSEMBLY_ACC=CAM_ASM_000871 /TAXON_ID=5961 /ORGANISM="Blepharisma japonicum, Strain Stock R1072" /LENGTH=216 /DNA_ID=CAMNT_0049651701 /DNA_START=51 /DNA_END=698 /DNA_ORIENTATION=+
MHGTYYVEGEKVRLTAELITGEPQQLDIAAVLLGSQTVYRGFMTDEMCDVETVLEMMKTQQASLKLVEGGLLLRCSPIKILLTPTDEELDFKDVRIGMLEENLEETKEQIKELQMRLQMLEERYRETGREVQPPEQRGDSRSELLTYHVWPKSRMLLAIVSRMLKEGLLNTQQRGNLKNLILDENPKLLQCLQQYEMDGDRRQLYSSFLKLSSGAA